MRIFIIKYALRRRSSTTPLAHSTHQGRIFLTQFVNGKWGEWLWWKVCCSWNRYAVGILWYYAVVGSYRDEGESLGGMLIVPEVKMQCHSPVMMLGDIQNIDPLQRYSPFPAHFTPLPAQLSTFHPLSLAPARLSTFHPSPCSNQHISPPVRLQILSRLQWPAR